MDRRAGRMPIGSAAEPGDSPRLQALLDPDSIPFDRPPYVALRSREEAAYVAETLADAFAATDGALEWLAAQAWRLPLLRRGRRRR